MRKNVNEFWVWCASQKDEFLATWRKSKHLIYNYNEKTGVAVITNLRTGKTASASANIQKTRGIMNVLGLAWAEYKGENIPLFLETIGELYARDCKHIKYRGDIFDIVCRNPNNSSCFICSELTVGKLLNIPAHTLVWPIE